MTDNFVSFDLAPDYLGHYADGSPIYPERWIREHWRKEGMPGVSRCRRVTFHVGDLIEWGRGKRFDKTA